MSVIAIPQILTERLTDEGARAFVEIIDKVEDHTQKATLEMAEERFEKRMSEELGKLRVEIQTMRADIIKWVFIFIFGQFWAIIGTLFVFFKS